MSASIGVLLFHYHANSTSSSYSGYSSIYYPLICTRGHHLSHSGGYMGIYVTPATKGLINDIHFGRVLIA